MSTALPEFWNLRRRYEGPGSPSDKTELPGVGADLVPPGHWGGEDAGGGREVVGGRDRRGGVPVVVHVLSPASDGPGPALGAGAEVIISDHDLIIGTSSPGGSLDCRHQVLSRLHLSYQIGHLGNSEKLGRIFFRNDS